MSYVNLENAKGLKEIGFAQQCYAFFNGNGDASLGDHHNVPHSEVVSRPDFLTAADWLAEKHSVCVSFPTPVDSIVYAGEVDKDFTGTNHRNAAIAHAISVIKKRNA